MAWGVSSYDKFYNWTWFNNGYHAEHHYRPRIHWTKMHELHEEIKEEQKRVGVRVIKPMHVFGFLAPPPPDESGAALTPHRSSEIKKELAETRKWFSARKNYRLILTR